jgi:iron complex transport system ATP-binding protein
MSEALTVADARLKMDGRMVLDSAGLSARPGAVVGVIGPNGAGKTTLMRAALGLQTLDGGEVRLGGRKLADLNEAERAAKAGYLPQERKVAWNLAALTLVSLGALNEPPKLAREIALAMLERVGMSRLADRGVLDMSGGERARVLLARLLATRAPLLMADEPAAGLDPDAQLLILEVLREEARRGAAVVLTLHDLTLAARFCDRIVALKNGRVAAEGPPAEALAPPVLRSVFDLDGSLVETSHGWVAAIRRSLG